MLYRLLVIAFICSLFTTVLSIRCYGGTGKNCMLLLDVSDCGDEDGDCVCSKYTFTCSDGDSGCTKTEQKNGAKKVSYAVVSQATCDDMKEDSDTYGDVTCCTTDKCNKPDSGKCNSLFGFRRASRKLADTYNI